MTKSPGRFEMTREYLVVYEKGGTNWSAFSPDIPRCGSLGETLDDARASMCEAMELYLSEAAKAGERVPNASATSVKFSEFDPDHQTKQYVVEWLSGAAATVHNTGARGVMSDYRGPSTPARKRRASAQDDTGCRFLANC
jgi:predicted RNase H-like HicB family nuclease